MVTLTFSYVRRVLKRRDAIVVLLLLPLACGVPKTILPSNPYAIGVMWACPLACAIVASVFLWFQKMLDDAIGLTDAIANTPSGYLAGAARVAAGAIITSGSTLILVFIAYLA